MKILFHSPATTVRRTGNRQTSLGWAGILRDAGHEVEVTSDYEDKKADLLVALHAVKSHDAAVRFLEVNPEGKLLLVLTGTDIYPEPGETALETMRLADQLVTLQDKAIDRVPAELRSRVTTVVQSARRIAERPANASPYFEVCVVGHFRDVKDPLLAARATLRLDSSSRIRVRHGGGILDEKYVPLIAREEDRNPFYLWLGELSEADTAALIASSDLLVVSSHSEGGARVVGEAIVHGTPVLSTRIDGVVGLLGEDYPGYYPVGDADALARLLERCESEPEFLDSLADWCRRIAPRFDPGLEARLLRDIVDSLA